MFTSAHVTSGMLQLKRFFSTSITPGTLYCNRYTVTMIPGDGIGKELCNSVRELFKQMKIPVDFEEIPLSGYTLDDKAFQNALESVKRNKLCIKGIIHTPQSTPFHPDSLNVSLRKKLDVYASVSIIKSIPGLTQRHENVDFIVVRENTEGEYSGLEHQPVEGVVESLKVITKRKSERIVKFAFDYAVTNRRRKVSCVHKANIMKLGDGLFLKSFHETASKFQSHGIAIDSLIVDNTAMQLVKKPQQFDVIVTPNLYGNIVTNIGAGLVGGPGFVSGYSMGEHYALYEPAGRFVAKGLEGKDLANPTTLILSSCHLLNHLGLEEYSRAIENGIYELFRSEPEFQQTSFQCSRLVSALLKRIK